MFSFGLLGLLWSWLCRGGSRGFGGVWSIHWRVRIDVWGGGVTLLVLLCILTHLLYFVMTFNYKFVFLDMFRMLFIVVD